MLSTCVLHFSKLWYPVVQILIISHLTVHLFLDKWDKSLEVNSFGKKKRKKKRVIKCPAALWQANIWLHQWQSSKQVFEDEKICKLGNTFREYLSPVFTIGSCNCTNYDWNKILQIPDLNFKDPNADEFLRIIFSPLILKEATNPLYQLGTGLLFLSTIPPFLFVGRETEVPFDDKQW